MQGVRESKVESVVIKLMYVVSVLMCACVSLGEHVALCSCLLSCKRIFLLISVDTNTQIHGLLKFFCGQFEIMYKYFSFPNYK